MDDETHGCDALLAEIDAFYQGFGHSAALTSAFRDAVVLVPLTDDERIPTSAVVGIDWVCAFTSEYEYARYLVARGEGSEVRKYHAVLGRRIVDDLIPTLQAPTGVVVDPCGAAPMAFPPAAEDVA
ncbi:hypothetical protein [Rhodococcus sp. NPDC058521]|uniref:hypothetical protein n=1 Tax=Rhodococcus sp. NPDC058521 TaxID=3346536 RepID=UPI00364C47B4